MARLVTTFVFLFICYCTTVVTASPSTAFSWSGNQEASPVMDLQFRCESDCSTPFFPPSPPSCPICAENYSSINSCAQAAPVLANISDAFWNPGAFIAVLKCACLDTFQSTYPQCVDCFTQTNQTDLLNCSTQDLPGILKGVREACAVESVLNANVSVADNETIPTPNGGVMAVEQGLTHSTHLLLIAALAAGALDILL